MYTDLCSEEKKQMAAFFTGHRFLPSDEMELISNRLFHCIDTAYMQGYRRFMCGCALGFDTLAAFQTLRLKQIYPDVILSLAIPCKTQPDRWPDRDQEIYRQILEQADEKIILSPVYYQGAMLTRNRYMADRSSLCICYLRHMRGGTASTVRYALTRDRMKIINLAVHMDENTLLMREDVWNCMSTFRSAGRNAAIAPLSLSPDRKLIMKHI